MNSSTSESLPSDLPVVAVEDVRKSYQGFPALLPLSFTIGQGEIFALLGPNGAGKTTLLRILTGILPPDTGTVRILGEAGSDVVRTKVGYLPEERGLYKKQKVGDILQYLGELKGLTAKKSRERTRIALKQVGMDAHENSLTDTLSKGMAQRIQIASALVHDPPFLILDEPFSGLDPVSARQMQEIVLEEKRRGRTVLLSTHQMEPVERICDRLLMLHRGQVVLYGTIDEVRARFAQSGLIRIEHETARLDSVYGLPSGFSVREATVPHVTVIAVPDDMSPQSALARLVERGIPIRGFTLIKPSLEDIFVQIVGGKPTADTAGNEVSKR